LLKNKFYWQDQWQTSALWYQLLILSTKIV